MMKLTWLDSNSWLWEIADKRILLDPWLIGSLVFGNIPWFFKGEKSGDRPIPDRLDAILLSQGLPDHAHPPTLAVLDRQIPVIGSPSAAQVAKELGFVTVTALAHGETFRLGDAVEIKALPGSPIGPQVTENAYLVRDAIAGHSLYYEPHGYHDANLAAEAPIDVAIVPITDISILHLIPVLKGQKTTLELCQRVRPQAILPTAGVGEITYEGLLSHILREDGTIAQFEADLRQAGLQTRVISPKPYETVDLVLDPPVASPAGV